MVPVIPSTGTFPFPAAVLQPDGELLRMARIGVAAPSPDGPLIMRVFTSAGGVVALHAEVTIAAFDQPVSPLRPGRPSYVVTDLDGGVWAITKGAGCGCSDPLKRFMPDRWVASPPE